MKRKKILAAFSSIIHDQSLFLDGQPYRLNARTLGCKMFTKIAEMTAVFNPWPRKFKVVEFNNNMSCSGQIVYQIFLI